MLFAIIFRHDGQNYYNYYTTGIVEHTSVSFHSWCLYRKYIKKKKKKEKKIFILVLLDRLRQSRVGKKEKDDSIY